MLAGSIYVFGFVLTVHDSLWDLQDKFSVLAVVQAVTELTACLSGYCCDMITLGISEVPM
jgi:hypothetical protein